MRGSFTFSQRTGNVQTYKVMQELIIGTTYRQSDCNPDTPVGFHKRYTSRTPDRPARPDRDPTSTDLRRSTELRCDFPEISVRIPGKSPKSPRGARPTSEPFADRRPTVRPSGARIQYRKRALQYTLIRKAWDPMGIELVPVWNELFLALIESEPPVQKNHAVYTYIYSSYIHHKQQNSGDTVSTVSMDG